MEGNRDYGGRSRELDKFEFRTRRKTSQPEGAREVYSLVVVPLTVISGLVKGWKVWVRTYFSPYWLADVPSLRQASSRTSLRCFDGETLMTALRAVESITTTWEAILWSPQNVGFLWKVGLIAS